VRAWGGCTGCLTAWKVLGGPVIGFRFFNQEKELEEKYMSIIVGDKCKPKYLGARKLSLRLGEKREVQFDWQVSDADHYSACL
jgi:hypothetical protein